MVVADADAARQHLIDHGVEASDVQEFPWGRFVMFADPDGNGWAVQRAPAAGLSGAQVSAAPSLRTASAASAGVVWKLVTKRTTPPPMA